MAEKIKILVVDNEKETLHLLTQVLSKAGYEVDTASDIQETFEKINKNGYSVLLIELNVANGTSNRDVIKKIKETNGDICVIVITAYPSIRSAVEAMREGAYDYITKPFDTEEIMLVVGRVAERYYLLKEAGQKELYRELAITDGLTGVYNHRHLHEVLPREIERAKRYSQPFSLLMIDIDDFKKFNDTQGHLAGDKLLSSLGRLLVAATRNADIIFRYGGEEFMVLLPQVGKKGGVEAAKRLLALIEQQLPIRVSIGVASFPEDGTNNKDELIHKADTAMYKAKQLGKNRICT